jgi:hypothetical protein
MEILWCSYKEQKVFIQTCSTCNKFPCKNIPKECIEQGIALQRELLKEQGYVEKISFRPLTKDKRRDNVMLVKWKSGKIEDVATLSSDLETLSKIECVYQIKSVLFPTLTLKPKESTTEEGPESTGIDDLLPKKRGRRSRKKATADEQG